MNFKNTILFEFFKIKFTEFQFILTNKMRILKLVMSSEPLKNKRKRDSAILLLLYSLANYEKLNYLLTQLKTQL